MSTILGPAIKLCLRTCGRSQRASTASVDCCSCWKGMQPSKQHRNSGSLLSRFSTIIIVATNPSLNPQHHLGKAHLCSVLIRLPHNKVGKRKWRARVEKLTYTKLSNKCMRAKLNLHQPCACNPEASSPCTLKINCQNCQVSQCA